MSATDGHKSNCLKHKIIITIKNKHEKLIGSQTGRCTPSAIPALGRLRKKDHKFDVGLSYIASSRSA
jgi:hypothetical protein